MSLPIQQNPYLRVQRNFPSEIQPLTVEIDRSYIDIAQKMNVRTIGVFSINLPTITGESWYLQGSSLKQQTLRQVYLFTAAGNIPHGLNLAQISDITKIYGTIYDGTNYYPLPYVDVVAANNQISVVVTPTNIVITAGAGSPPNIVSGIVVLEWLSNV